MSYTEQEIEAISQLFGKTHEHVLERLASAEHDDEVFGIIRDHIANAGCKPAFVDDGVRVVILELLEFRRRFNDGKRLDLGEVGEEILCQHCNLPETFHSLDTVECKEYSVWQPESSEDKGKEFKNAS